MTYRVIHNRMLELADSNDAAVLQWFFKTGPGEYGEGDVFIGLKVPKIRALVKAFGGAGEPVVRRLLASPIHEERLLALFILVRQFERGTPADRLRIYRLYLGSTARINNWDLVDLSAPAILGGYLQDRSRRPLYRLVRSPSLWERRMAMLATFVFIRAGEFDEALALAEHLLHDREDLIHKAVGWMLREIGKRDGLRLEAFLKSHCATMPRTMLRYAIERFPEAKRRRFLDARQASKGRTD